MSDRPTRERVRELLSYDSETGVFVWKVKRRCVNPGEVAGCIHKTGYRVITLDGRPYLAHRLAWLYVHGECPKGGIDHINRCRNDNAIKNLREATQSQNMANAVQTRRSSTGHVGVYRSGNGYIAQLSASGRNHHLGWFPTLLEAAKVAQEARIQHFGAYAAGVSNV